MSSRRLRRLAVAVLTLTFAVPLSLSQIGLAQKEQDPMNKPRKEKAELKLSGKTNGARLNGKSMNGKSLNGKSLNGHGGKSASKMVAAKSGILAKPRQLQESRASA